MIDNPPRFFAATMAALAAILSPPLAARQGSFVSDDFNSCSGLQGFWSQVDPLGDATFELLGGGTEEALLAVGVPGGASHDAYDTNLAPRLMQLASDEDFELEVKFVTEPTQSAQIQGVIIEQDAANWLRFDFFGKNGKIRVYAGQTTGGQTQARANRQIASGPSGQPLWMRVRRVGDSFSQSFSRDGVDYSSVTSFTAVMAVTSVGVFGGNAGNPAPAFSARCDYVFESSAPIVPEDGSPPAEYYIDTTVVGSGSVSLDPDAQPYACGESVSITALPAAGWRFDHWEQDLTASSNPATVVVGSDLDVRAVFEVDSGPPIISDVAVEAQARQARITWTTNEPATSVVEFGPSASYGQQVSSSELVQSHDLLLSGLEPSSLYHFRITSTDSSQSSASTQDDTFFTALGSGLISDDFSSCTGLSAVWTLVDPLADASFQVTGTGTSDARLEIGVAGGTSHDPYHANLAPRAMQAVEDSDFSVTVRFDSRPSQRYQLQGVIVEQGPSDWLRFDFHHDGRRIKSYAGVTVGGVTSTRSNTNIGNPAAPLYLRVSRLGVSWTMEWSVDGLSWSPTAAFDHPMQVSQVGVFAANAGPNAPAYTGLIDYCFNDAAPIYEEDGSVGNGPFDLSLSTHGNGSVTVDPPVGPYPCGTVVTLTAIADPGWRFDHWQGLAAGSGNPVQVTMDRNRTVAATFLSDGEPPVISNVSVIPGTTTAQVNWTTNQPATSHMDYGLTAAYGDSESDSSLVTQHSLLLGNLVPDTTYHFRLTSVNGQGGTSSTSDSVFTTNPSQGAPFLSDDFSSCGGLAGFWTFIDPRNDSSAQIVGKGTQDARLQLFVPGGVSHDPFDVNNAPRVVQAANDVDFEVEAKFDSLQSSATQIQGVLIEQDVDDWLRFDFFSTSSQLRFYVGSTVAGDTTGILNTGLGAQLAPLWIRVQRLGDQFTVLWSSDGASFTQLIQFTRVMAVQTVGVYGGNAGNANAPSFTCLVDYLFDTANPIVPEDGASGGGPYTLTVSVLGQGGVILDPDQPNYDCGTEVILTAVPVAGWRFDHWELDLTGLQNPASLVIDSDEEVRAVFVQDQDPPIISNVVVTTGASTALVTWNTNEPATSRVDYGPDSGYGQFAQEGQLVTQHSLAISGLTPDSTYHYQVTSVDSVGLSASTADDTFDTQALVDVPRDDFNSHNLDLSKWTYLDANEDGVLELMGSGTPNAHLRLGVPSGTIHDPDDDADSAVRLRQTIEDDDFDVVLKWESSLNQKFQIQGLIIEQDPLNFVRCDFHFDGVNLKAFASTSTNGSGTIRGNVVAASGPWPGGPLYMRVTRIGDSWTYRTSFDAIQWTVAVGPFSFPLAVTAMGPFAGNAPSGGNPAPSHIAKLDWIAPFDDPIVNEDSGIPADQNPPYLYRAQLGLLTETSARVDWFTDESATGRVQYGLTTNYELGSSPIVGPGWGLSHLLTGLSPDTLYHYRVVSEDSGLRQTIGSDGQFRTHPGGGGGEVPFFDIWYGVDEGNAVVRQRFGQRGKPQNWVDVLGDVFDPNGTVVDLEYRLNGGPAHFLNMGPDPRRLKGVGDFIIEIAWADLLPGDNQVVITATDDDGNVVDKTVIVDYFDTVGPDTYAVTDYGADPDLLEVVQVVQGEFEVSGTDLHVRTPGYDRLFAMGDVTHTDYEVTLEVTVHSLTPDGYDPPSNGPAIGMGLRWLGHNGPDQPMRGFWPTGAFVWFRWLTNSESWQIRTNEYNHIVGDQDNFEFGATYVLKARVETLPGNVPQFRFRYWKTSETEPSTWNLQVQGDPVDPQNGAILFLAHECDATFGPISVVPLGDN